MIEFRGVGDWYVVVAQDSHWIGEIRCPGGRGPVVCMIGAKVDLSSADLDAIARRMEQLARDLGISEVA